jgi:hypothetical protein
LYINELKGDYFESLLGLFYKYYDTDKSFAGFNAPKYPDVDFTVYGLIQKDKDVLARGMIESNLRDIIRSQSIFAETYTNEDIPHPGGVRPSIFGMAATIDFTLLKNGYMFTKGTPCLVNIYPDEKTGVSNTRYRGKYIDMYKPEEGKIILSGSAFDSPKSIDPDVKIKLLK